MFILRDEMEASHQLDLLFEGLVEALVVQHECRFVVLAYYRAARCVHHLVQCAVTAGQADDHIRFVPHTLLALGHVIDLNKIVAVRSKSTCRFDTRRDDANDMCARCFRSIAHA